MFTIITINDSAMETSRLTLSDESKAIYHARKLLYTQGTFEVLILKDGQKFCVYYVSADGTPDCSIF